ncbi:hypothetical protein BUALT_Bualt05G0053800 [Buddleja alternifolia]|uniref:Retrotransposon gag domain-containing protein n=1 Tax=Buddleja alternifolia TaxID=168488 RepID=A0AAV6XIE3_9LAMI|nr:hypothetical protein BUALT_Bualt05G0053800 [Buddleja alternifolia]
MMVERVVAEANGYRPGNGPPEEAMERGSESQNRRGPPAWQPKYHMPTKCSTIESLDSMERTCEIGYSSVSSSWRWMKHHWTLRFGTQLYEDPMSELMNLRQMGSAKEYLDQFDELLNHVDLYETYAISCFLVGLKSDIAIQEEAIQITSEEEGMNGTITDSHVSMHALSGVHDYRTMRVTGNVNGKPVHILIDTDSTHNFIDIKPAKRLRCKIVETTPFHVSVADGNKIFGLAVCKGFSWKLQGTVFTTDMLLLPLGGYDVVLGVQWLITLGNISWNFKINSRWNSLWRVRRFHLGGCNPPPLKASVNTK